MSDLTTLTAKACLTILYWCFLYHIALKYDNKPILGDSNIHICSPSKVMIHNFTNLRESFGLQQSVKGPIHVKGHIVDLVLFSQSSTVW